MTGLAFALVVAGALLVSLSCVMFARGLFLLNLREASSCLSRNLHKRSLIRHI